MASSMMKLPLLRRVVTRPPVTTRAFSNNNSKAPRVASPFTQQTDDWDRPLPSLFSSIINDLDALWALQPTAADKSRRQLTAGWQPTCDVRDAGDAYIVHAELPGVRKEDIDVEVHDGTLTIKGKKDSGIVENKAGDADANDNAWVRRERSFGSFTRRFTLPEGVDESHVKASFADGVLDVRIAKPAAQTPKAAAKVQVQ